MSRADLDAQRASFNTEFSGASENLALGNGEYWGPYYALRWEQWQKAWQAALASQAPASAVLITPREAAAAGLECGDSACTGCCSGEGPCMYDAQAPLWDAEDMVLPPLPLVTCSWTGRTVAPFIYTGKEMQDYARATIAAARRKK